MKAEQDELRREEILREEAAAWLARLRGACSSEDHAAFEDWFAADPDHAAAYEAVLASWKLTGSTAATPAGRARPQRQPRANARRYAALAAAASLAVALLAFGTYGAGFMGQGLAEPEQFASPPGNIRVLALADGSRATLDTDSALRPAYSADERRVVLLRGRARFAVAHESDRPFIVAAGTGLVVARGTVFDVALEDGQVTVVLLEGSVEVRARQEADMTAPRKMLAPGQSVVLQAGRIEALSSAGEKAGSDWPSGMLSFDGAPLGEVVEAANRYGTSRIILADAALAKLRFTGTFNAGANEQLARMIAETFALRLSRSNGTLVLAPAGEAQTGD
jgi:transmembrane sensor